MPHLPPKSELSISQAYFSSMRLKLLVRPRDRRPAQAQSNMGLVQSISTSAGQRNGLNVSQNNGKMTSAKCATKNQQARRALRSRQQTLDSGYSSSTMLDAASKCADDKSDMVMDIDACNVETAEFSTIPTTRLPQPYDGLLAPGEDVPRSPSWMALRRAGTREDRYLLFRKRRQKDWRSIPVFYEDDEENDRDETFVSRYRLNPLRTMRPPTESIGGALSRDRVCSLFGEDPDSSTSTSSIYANASWSELIDSTTSGAASNAHALHD
nr:hypothetical protein CFP56_67032 [Quercus suber]